MDRKKSRALEKDKARLFEHLENMEFESMDEINAFLEQFNGKRIDEVLGSDDSYTDADRAEDMVDEAYEKSPTKGRRLAKQALKLDPHCVEAYFYLATTERNAKKKLQYIQEAIDISREMIGDEYEEMRGNFWLYHPSRPYMRAMQFYGEILTEEGRFMEAKDHFAEMLALNPFDNQGIRYHYLPLLVLLGDYEAYENTLEDFPDEEMTSWKITKALASFERFGRSKQSYNGLIEVHKANPFFLPLLLSLIDLPEEPPEYYSPGDINEAYQCLSETVVAWAHVEGALNWAMEMFMQLHEEGAYE